MSVLMFVCMSGSREGQVLVRVCVAVRGQREGHAELLRGPTVDGGRTRRRARGHRAHMATT